MNSPPPAQLNVRVAVSVVLSTLASTAWPEGQNPAEVVKVPFVEEVCVVTPVEDELERRRSAPRAPGRRRRRDRGGDEHDHCGDAA